MSCSQPARHKSAETQKRRNVKTQSLRGFFVAQTFSDWEFVLVDHGSTDTTS